jgi:hypothetical protein
MKPTPMGPQLFGVPFRCVPMMAGVVALVVSDGISAEQRSHSPEVCE